jgi:hypothetical protein
MSRLLTLVRVGARIDQTGRAHLSPGTTCTRWPHHAGNAGPERRVLWHFLWAILGENANQRSRAEQAIILASKVHSDAR